MKFKLESNGHTPSFELHNHFFQLKTFHFKPFKVIPYRRPIKHPCGYLISIIITFKYLTLLNPFVFVFNLYKLLAGKTNRYVKAIKQE